MDKIKSGSAFESSVGLLAWLCYNLKSTSSFTGTVLVFSSDCSFSSIVLVHSVRRTVRCSSRSMTVPPSSRIWSTWWSSTSSTGAFFPASSSTPAPPWPCDTPPLLICTPFPPLCSHQHREVREMKKCYTVFQGWSRTCWRFSPACQAVPMHLIDLMWSQKTRKVLELECCRSSGLNKTSFPHPQGLMSKQGMLPWPPHWSSETEGSFSIWEFLNLCSPV